jgi:hypothetical protein
MRASSPRLPGGRRRLAVLGLSVSIPLAGTLLAQTPDEVQGVGFASREWLTWSPAALAEVYHVYRGRVAGLGAGIPARCHGYEIAGTSFATPAAPDLGEAFFYLVTGESLAGAEGTPGADSKQVERALLGRCRPAMHAHLQNRLGYGWSEWTRDRIRTLGIAGYVEEQLDPETIDESSNTDLNARLSALTPPEHVVDLIGSQVVRGTYSRRQLEQQAASFWANHFNTFWLKVEMFLRDWFPACQSPGVPPQCDPFFSQQAQLLASTLLGREIARFRHLAFYGTFRQMVEASALSPAMIIYLDSVLSVAGNPNENYPRELLELYTMGVDGGYTQTDVEELSRVITGWSFCKKATADLADPLAPCIENYWEPLPAGEFVADFEPALHDCTAKTLFAGTPQEFTIPDTCGDPAQGVNDLFLALDGIVAHPGTARFISKKILEQFVTEAPSEAMIATLVTAWNDPGNPRGVGDMRAVLEAALGLPEFLDPDRTRSKIKTPLEHLISALRATRGQTNGITAVNAFLAATAHQVHLNPTPTGWDEAGFNWINTNNMLDRQNVGYELVMSTNPDFSGRPLTLLVANGVDTAPGNAEAIVDFFAEALFGGALTPAERQAAIDYLNTDDLGVPSPYDSDRIRQVVSLMLGYPQFEEQ